MVTCGLSNRREHQEKALGMKHYAGLDVSLKEISIRIVDQTGSVLPRDEGTQPLGGSRPCDPESFLAAGPDRA